MIESKVNPNGNASHTALSREEYGENIEKRYRNIPIEKIREMVDDYKSRGFLEKMFGVSSAEKIEIGVARKILRERDAH